MKPTSSSPVVYASVFAALLGLTAATVATAYVDLGILNLVAALAIAAVKAGLVMAFFMDLRHSSHLVRLYAGAGFLWLALLIGLTLTDTLTRSWL